MTKKKKTENPQDLHLILLAQIERLIQMAEKVRETKDNLYRAVETQEERHQSEDRV